MERTSNIIIKAKVRGAFNASYRHLAFFRDMK